MIELDEETFSQLTQEAIDSLPPQFRERLENIAIDIQPLPDEETCERLDLESPYFLFGLYHGVPLPDRSVLSPFSWPDRITIYQLSIESACNSERQVVEQVRKTVLHEIGHFFGLDEDDLDALGYG